MTLMTMPPINRKRQRIADTLEPRTEGKEQALLPQWRWDRAEHALQHLGQARRYTPRRGFDCPIFIQQVLPFCEAQRDARAYEDLLKLEQRYPAALWAKRTYCDHTEEITRWIVEALVCAGASEEEIGLQLGVPTAYIWWYEKMFFDVREYIDHPTAMIRRVFRHSSLKAPKVEDFLWKSIAWKHGLGVEGLQQLINPISQLSNDTLALFRNIITKRMLLDTVLAQSVRQIGNFNSNFVIDQFQRMLEKGKDEDEVGSTSPLEAGMRTFLEYYAHHLGVAKFETEFRGVEMAAEDTPGSELYRQRREQKALAEAQDSENLQGQDGATDTGDTI